MNINLGAVIIDVAELDPESAFWHRLLGGSIANTATHHFLRDDGRAERVGKSPRQTGR